jgi:hypothetical protein
LIVKTFLEFTEQSLQESYEIYDTSGKKSKKIATVRTNRDLDDWMNDNEGSYSTIVVRRNDGNTVKYTSNRKGWEITDTGRDVGKLIEARRPRDPGMSAGGYSIYHKTFSAAVQHAIEVTNKKGYEVDEDDWFRKVASGPRKPSTGKTNSYSINLTKNGKEVRQSLNMQVYFDGSRYELNMYVS